MALDALRYDHSAPLGFKELRPILLALEMSGRILTLVALALDALALALH